MSDKKSLVKISDLIEGPVALFCDHTNLSRPECLRGKSENPVRDWEKSFYNFLEETLGFLYLPYAICVNYNTVKNTKHFLETNGVDVKTTATTGFPNGSFYDLKGKVKETELAIDYGANEVDFVINYNKLKEGDLEYVGVEMRTIAKICSDNRVLSKAILETSELNSEKIMQACQLANDNGVDFVKTSTGFSNGGAKIEDLSIMKEHFPRGIKASGGIGLENAGGILTALSGRTDGYIEDNPLKYRLGVGSYLNKLFNKGKEKEGY